MIRSHETSSTDGVTGRGAVAGCGMLNCVVSAVGGGAGRSNAGMAPTVRLALCGVVLATGGAGASRTAETCGAGSVDCSRGVTIGGATARGSFDTPGTASSVAGTPRCAGTGGSAGKWRSSLDLPPGAAVGAPDTRAPTGRSGAVGGDEAGGRAADCGASGPGMAGCGVADGGASGRGAVTRGAGADTGAMRATVAESAAGVPPSSDALETRTAGRRTDGPAATRSATARCSAESGRGRRTPATARGTTSRSSREEVTERCEPSGAPVVGGYAAAACREAEVRSMSDAGVAGAGSGSGSSAIARSSSTRSKNPDGMSTMGTSGSDRRAGDGGVEGMPLESPSRSEKSDESSVGSGAMGGGSKNAGGMSIRSEYELIRGRDGAAGPPVSGDSSALEKLESGPNPRSLNVPNSSSTWPDSARLRTGAVSPTVGSDESERSESSRPDIEQRRYGFAGAANVRHGSPNASKFRNLRHKLDLHVCTVHTTCDASITIPESPR